MNYDRFACYVCKRAGVRGVRAVVRIFSGTYGGGGFPACDDHGFFAQTDALAPLGEKSTDRNYTVTAFEVRWEGDEPKMGRKLWTARRRQVRAP